jgi:hypothetical protein
MQMPLTLSLRRAAVLVAMLVLLVAGALALANSTGAGAAPTARLALVKMNPATVSGHGFRAHARVHLMLVADGTFSRRPLTSRFGAFTVTFPAVIDRCSGWSVTATQPGRTPVILRSPAKPACAPLRAP